MEQEKKIHKTKIVIISGPAGAGKTTLLSRLFRRRYVKNNFTLAVSYTTRKKRPKEKQGVDYFYISEQEFKRLKKEGFFLEHEKVVDDYYGTPKYFLGNARKKEKNLVLCIDVKGAMQLKRSLKSLPVVTIFINAPSYDHLHKRMRGRADARDLMHKRIKLAKKELQYIKKYDYLIVNQNIDKSLKILEAVLIAESIRRV